MGKLALAANITHVPSMYLSELPGKNHGCRQGAIDGHKEISKRCREMGVDTIIVFDTHWLVNSAYHINCADHFEGVYTSNELPHFIRDMTYNYEGNPELGQLIADEALKLGNSKVFNIIVLGVAAKHMDFSKEAWLNVIEKTVPPKTVEINKKAFLLGYES